MHRAALAALMVLALPAAVFWWLTRPAELSAPFLAVLHAQPGDATRGESVFWAGGCAGCHADPGLDASAPTQARLVLGGGRAFVTPFGTFHAPNISTDPQAGIGGWSLDDFARALTLGVSPDGQHYYPAFPYTTYTRADPRDIADLWAFWQTLPASPTASLAHELRFPFTFRRGLGLWKILNFNRDFIEPEPADPQLRRGRYLVEALAHCGECHTPRNALGGLDRSRWMAGAADPAGGDGRIPPLPPRNWSAQDISLFLQSGFTPTFDVVGGSMAEVVANTSHLAPEDRDAIAAYIVSLRSSPNR